MTGYRDHSFDPNGGADSRPPLRPFTATQWAGLGLLLLGALAIVIYLLGRIGAIPKIIDDEIPFVSVMPLGAVLMNARRRTAPCDAEALKRRRIIVVILALAAAVLGAVLAFLIARGG
jgi:hypothetical protein